MRAANISIPLEYAAVRDLRDLPNNGPVDLPEACTVAELLRRGGVRPEQLRYVIPIINGVKRRVDTVLEHGDRVVLRLLLGGV